MPPLDPEVPLEIPLEELELLLLPEDTEEDELPDEKPEPDALPVAGCEPEDAAPLELVPVFAVPVALAEPEEPLPVVPLEPAFPPALFSAVPALLPEPPFAVPNDPVRDDVVGVFALPDGAGVGAVLPPVPAAGWDGAGAWAFPAPAAAAPIAPMAAPASAPVISPEEIEELRP